MYGPAATDWAVGVSLFFFKCKECLPGPGALRGLYCRHIEEYVPSLDSIQDKIGS